MTWPLWPLERYPWHHICSSQNHRVADWSMCVQSDPFLSERKTTLTNDLSSLRAKDLRERGRDGTRSPQEDRGRHRARQTLRQSQGLQLQNRYETGAKRWCWWDRRRLSYPRRSICVASSFTSTGWRSFYRSNSAGSDLFVLIRTYLLYC